MTRRKDSAPPPPPPDVTPPANVRALTAKTGDRTITLTWKNPPDPDFDHVEVESFYSGPAASVAYRGSETSFTASGLKNGISYRFVVVSYDRVGNASVGLAIEAKPQVTMLIRPPAGAVVRTPLRFTWRPDRGATYYNLQLYRLGPSAASVGAPASVKVLSTWPTHNVFKLRPTWNFAKRTQRLVPGSYRWYVWPGYGARGRAQYGPLLGESTFTVRAR